MHPLAHPLTHAHTLALALARLVAGPTPTPAATTVAAHPTWALIALLVGPLALALVGLGIVRLRHSTQ
ncbi:MAG TPA: hypothetical protein VFW71_06235 [Actinomycetota bacterium]|nr:hypothetical protein [Actinomycetota bacterium]